MSGWRQDAVVDRERRNVRLHTAVQDIEDDIAFRPHEPDTAVVVEAARDRSMVEFNRSYHPMGVTITQKPVWLLSLRDGPESLLIIAGIQEYQN